MGTQAQRLRQTVDELEGPACYSVAGQRIYYRSAPAINPSASTLVSATLDGTDQFNDLLYE